MKWNLFGAIVLTLFVMSCRVQKRMIKQSNRGLVTNLSEGLLDKHYVGFALFDPETKQYLYQQHSNKYFTPASNTKILTLYASLKILDDNLTTFQYAEAKDSLILMGSGNPDFLNPLLPPSHREINFLLNHQKKHIFIVENHFQDGHFGAGWSWDDALYAYQLHKTPFPIYGNRVEVSGVPFTKDFILYPRFFQRYVQTNPDSTYEYGRIVRDEHHNSFHYNNQYFDSIRHERNIPIHFRPGIFNQLLSDTLKRRVGSIDRIYQHWQFNPIKSDVPTDSIYKLLMCDSDNFVAEQLLLNASMELFDTMNTNKVIQWIQDSIYADITDPFIWADGSGLSRYNMFTPRSLVELLNKLIDLKGIDWIQKIFPAGGVSGTIEEWYAADHEPYIWAKTGTLRHNHNLSGYIQCVSGKVMIFSFMNNHFTTSSSTIKPSMERVLKFIRNNY